MNSNTNPLYLLKNHIDLRAVPFSDRGSTLLLFQSPENASLYIKLAERLIFLDSDIEASLKRPPFVSDLCVLDENGKPLDLEITTYPHILKLVTRIGEFGVAFQDERTLSIGLPPGKTAGIRFQISAQSAGAGSRGGQMKAARDLVYQSSAAPVVNKVQAINGSYIVEFIIEAGRDNVITISIDEKQPTGEAQPFSQSAAQAETRWRDWFEKAPLVDERYQKTYYLAWWVVANNLISPRGSVAYEAMVPSKTKYVGLWLWDSAMHALAYRHIDAVLAQNQLRSMLACQLPDGMLPDAIHDEGVISELDHPFKARVTKPPILAWAAMKLYEHDPDAAFLKEIYQPLARWNTWWFEHNDDDGDGLAQYNHPYSSGLDDSPLWDYGMPVVSPDLNTYLCLQMKALARMAEILGLPTEAENWRKQASAMVEKMMRALWDEKCGYFRALHAGQPIPVLTPFNLYPLWSGLLPEDIRARLLAHLTNESEFWGEFPLPTVARSDAHFDPDLMWRGPVWANINYFFVEALQASGEKQLAAILRQKTLEMIMANAGIHEYYNTQTGAPASKAAPIFGWTAAVFIDLAIQASHEA